MHQILEWEFLLSYHKGAIFNVDQAVMVLKKVQTQNALVLYISNPHLVRQIQRPKSQYKIHLPMHWSPLTRHRPQITVHGLNVQPVLS